jgi:hypothetical protein
MPRKRLPIAFCFLCAHLDDTKRCIRIGRLRYDRPSLTPAGHLLAQEACVACGSGSGKKESKKDSRFFVSSLRLPIETARFLPRQAQGKHQIVRNQNGGWVGGIGEKEQLRGVSLFSFLFFSPEPSGASLVATVVPAETHFCQWFRYVCPEPVLANVQLFDVCNGIIAKKLFRTGIREEIVLALVPAHTHTERERARASAQLIVLSEGGSSGGQQLIVLLPGPSCESHVDEWCGHSTPQPAVPKLRVLRTCIRKRMYIGSFLNLSYACPEPVLVK